MTAARKKAPAQTERVLALLRERALHDRSLNPVDLLDATADGGPPILRLPARINNLRDAGYRIYTRRAPNRTADYFLLGEPTPPLPPRTHGQPLSAAEQERLFPLRDVIPHDTHVQDARREAA